MHIYLDAIGRASGMTDRLRTDRAAGASHQLRFSHYPPRLDGDDRFPPHRDFGLLTLVLGGAVPGLELWIGETWVRPEMRLGDLLILPGNAMQVETDGRIKAMRHRVAIEEGERYSVIFFLEPRQDVTLANGERAGEYFRRMMDKTKPY